MSTRRALALVAPTPQPRPKPVYARVPLYGAVIVDRRDQWQLRRDAAESERLRLGAFGRVGGKG